MSASHKETTMRRYAPLLILPLAFCAGRASAQAKASPGDLGLYTLPSGEVRPAIVVDDAGEDGRPVLHVFLAPGDADAIARDHNDAAMGRRVVGRATRETKAGLPLVNGLRDGGLVLSAEPDEWSPR